MRPVVLEVWRRVGGLRFGGVWGWHGYDGPTKVVVWIAGLGGDVASGRTRL